MRRGLQVDLVVIAGAIKARARHHAAVALDDRPTRSMVLIDIAVPRDVEPAASGVHGVVLFDIDGTILKSQHAGVQAMLDAR